MTILRISFKVHLLHLLVCLWWNTALPATLTWSVVVPSCHRNNLQYPLNLRSYISFPGGWSTWYVQHWCVWLGSSCAWGQNCGQFLSTWLEGGPLLTSPRLTISKMWPPLWWLEMWTLVWHWDVFPWAPISWHSRAQSDEPLLLSEWWMRWALDQNSRKPIKSRAQELTILMVRFKQSRMKKLLAGLPHHKRPQLIICYCIYTQYIPSELELTVSIDLPNKQWPKQNGPLN